MSWPHLSDEKLEQFWREREGLYQELQLRHQGNKKRRSVNPLLRQYWSLTGSEKRSLRQELGLAR